jgi:hypothetical protein
LVFVDFVVEENYNCQFGKKRFGPSGCAITTFLGAHKFAQKR